MISSLEIDDLVVTFGGRRDPLHAVDGVSLVVAGGETLGIIGESGSGKSTLARAVAGLTPPSAGRITIRDADGADMPLEDRPGRSGMVQMIFQDPVLSLNPRMPIWKSVAEPLAGRARRVQSGLREQAEQLLEDVGLDRHLADRKPRQLSGGQRQRVTIARMVAAGAPVVMCDEPVAALDVSLQAGVLRLLHGLQEQHGYVYLFISHDMSSIARIADRVGVMYLGQVVEIGSVDEVLLRPRHPYTKVLIDSIPQVDRPVTGETRGLARGEIPDGRHPPSGCRFRTRCPWARDHCAEVEPRLGGESDGDPHQVSCHFWEELSH